MELHFWLIPLVAIVVAGVGGFYLVIRSTGGSGERTEGQTLFDAPVKKEEPKVGWNYYEKPGR